MWMCWRLRLCFMMQKTHWKDSFQDRGADPELATLAPLCLTLHSLHSSVQISKNTSNNFIVLDREERKSSSIVTIIKLIMPADEWGTISVTVCNDCCFPRTIRAEGNCCNVKWNSPLLFITQEDGVYNAVKNIQCIDYSDTAPWKWMKRHRNSPEWKKEWKITVIQV